MNNKVIKPIGLVVVVVAATVLFSCQGKSKSSPGYENMPFFEEKFPQKKVWVQSNGNDSTEISFSSMEEAEWILMHVVPGWSFESFEKILLSDPSSMDYSFDSLFQDTDTYRDVLPLVTSDDGNVRCIGLNPHSAHAMPMMLVYYRVNGTICKAEESTRFEDCYYCLLPDTIYVFNTNYSTLYFVWGYNGYTGSGDSYRLCAYELDESDLHPAFVFDEKGRLSDMEENGQSLYTEICTNDVLYESLAENHFRTLGYIDPNESAVYIRTYTHKEMDEYSCSSQISNDYRKFVWDGKKFMLEEQ